MNLKERTLKNSAYSIIAQISMILLRFVSRFFLIRCVGIKLVGLSDTISSTVGMLSLAEAGIGSSISYSLYQPVHDKNQETINKIMNVFERLYATLSIIIACIGIFGTWCLKYILKGVNINNTVYSIYFIYVANSCISYLLCQRRVLLYVDIREYLVKKIDIITNFIFSFLGVLTVLITHNLILYTVTILLQTFFSNVWIHVNSKEIYPYLKKGKIDICILRNTLSYAKDLFWGTLAAFVYGSTDNVIISIFLGTVHVGYVGNYLLVSKSIQTIIYRLISPITPTIGRFQRENITKEMFYNIFMKYHQFCYIMALIITVPMLILFDDFIIFAFGEEYLLAPSIKYMLTLVFYMNVTAFSYGTILVTSGEFKLLKKVEIIGAFLNIITSLILINMIGLTGVFLGTAITVIVQWVIRSYMVYINNLSLGEKAWFISVLKEIYKIIIVFIGYICGSYVCNTVKTMSFDFIMKFILCGFTSIILSLLLYMTLYRFSDRITVKSVISLFKVKR